MQAYTRSVDYLSEGEERDVLPILTPVRLGRKDLFSCDWQYLDRLA